jgi:[acyl-carrier-protein] S-malonyltransferase
MSFEDGLKLVKLRGESMQAAADAVRSGMVSVIGLDKEKVAALCEAATEEVRGAWGGVLGGVQCVLLGA